MNERLGAALDTMTLITGSLLGRALTGFGVTMGAEIDRKQYQMFKETTKLGLGWALGNKKMIDEAQKAVDNYLLKHPENFYS